MKVMRLGTAIFVIALLLAACDSSSSDTAGSADTPTTTGTISQGPGPVDGADIVLSLIDDEAIEADSSRLTPADVVQECRAFSIPNYYFDSFPANSVPSFLASVPNWLEASGSTVSFDGVQVRSFEDVGFDSVEDLVPGGSRVLLDVSGATIVSGQRGDSTRFEIARTIVEALAGDVAAGSSLLIGYLPDGTATVLSVRPDGTVSTLDCDTGYPVLNNAQMVDELGFESPAEMVRAFTVEGRAEVAEQIENYLDTERAAEEAARVNSGAWANQDPMRRSVDLSTPPEVLAGLDPESIEIHLPANWPGEADLAVCIRQSIGWGPCVPLTSVFEDNTVTIPVFIDRTLPLELWFLDSDGRFESATGPFQTFDPDELPEGDGWILSSTAGTPPAEVVRASAAGTYTVFQLTPHG